MRRAVCRSLRPALFRSNALAPRPSHGRAVLHCQQTRYSSTTADDYTNYRLQQLKHLAPHDSYWPRFTRAPGAQLLSPKVFRAQFEALAPGDQGDTIVQVFGRINSLRAAGTRLRFIDFGRDNEKLQAILEFKQLRQGQGVDILEFNRFKKLVKRGDWMSVIGYPSRTVTGELSIKATHLPSVLSLALQHLPENVDDPETLATKPHLHGLMYRRRGDILRLRSYVYRYFRHHLDKDGFTEVETPMFDAGAGGAVARPFWTVANEMSEKTIKLRVAPELYLKRLIVEGNEKVFEIGRVFRNEGIDNTHNPEFTICEFYEVGATLEDLIARTERLFRDLATSIGSARATHFPSIPDIVTGPARWRLPFARLPFIPTVEKALGRKLPNLESDVAVDELLGIFEEHRLPVPKTVTLPKLLDILATEFIEPLCAEPTFITHHPEVMAPLAKSYVDPDSGQRVGARAELFIEGREYVNCYEEENSPLEQRRKFKLQVKHYPAREGGISIDESYIEALEWGMPPTGGWGCGMDRIVMLFSGAKRIADVLPFGTLRNVVSLSQNK